jgi:hypothetical protein
MRGTGRSAPGESLRGGDGIDPGDLGESGEVGVGTDDLEPILDAERRERRVAGSRRSSPRRMSSFTASLTPRPSSRRSASTALAVSGSNSTVVRMAGFQHVRARYRTWQCKYGRIEAGARRYCITNSVKYRA